MAEANSIETVERPQYFANDSARDQAKLLTGLSLDSRTADAVSNALETLYAIESLSKIQAAFEVERLFARDGEKDVSLLSDHDAERLGRSIRLLAQFGADQLSNLVVAANEAAKKH